MDVAALLEEQEAIALRNLKQEKGETRIKTEPSPESNALSRQKELDRDQADDRYRRRERERGFDHYDGRRSNRRSPHDRYSNEREENDQRRSRRSKDLVDDGDMRHNSDRESANGGSRSKLRSRSPRPSSRRHDDRGYRRRSRSHSVSPRRYSHGPDSHPSRHSRREDERRRRRGDGPRQPYRSPDGRRRTPELNDDDRDGRTVFVQQLAARLKAKELRKFFEQVGDVIDAQIVTDRVSGRSKGVGYVEFKDIASVQAAIGLTGQKLSGIPIIVQVTEAEKNRQARDKETTSNRNNSAPQTRLYVGNIQFSISEADLYNVFYPWGPLVSVSLQKDETGRSKGYAFVEYEKPESAKQALENMNNFKLGDRAIRVGLGGDRNSSIPDSDRVPNANARGHYEGSSFSGMGGRGAHAGGTGTFDRAGGRDNEKTSGGSALDDVDMDGVNFNNFSRDALMRKLARTDEPALAAAPKVEQKKATVQQPTATRCILLKHVYNESLIAQIGPNWRAEIKEDIESECSNKYGKVVHCAPALDSDEGEVYIKFETVKGGENAYKSLQGRIFSGNRITAQYVVDVVYNSLFPKAASV